MFEKSGEVIFKPTPFYPIEFIGGPIDGYRIATDYPYLFLDVASECGNHNYRYWPDGTQNTNGDNVYRFHEIIDSDSVMVD